MSQCYNYDQDNALKLFQVVEFKPSFVGLSTTQIINVEIDLSKSAYFKTMCEGQLMKFDEARHISASHRAFDVVVKDPHTIQVTFQPRNECLSKAKHDIHQDNRFIFDLRLIQVDEIRCCDLEQHSEIGRYYISGEYGLCKISHYPKVINFGEVEINTRVTKFLRIRNESTSIAANVLVERETCFEISPMKFTIAPNSSKRLSVTVKPTGMKVAKVIYLKIRNPHDVLFNSKAETSDDENYITYVITNNINISFTKNVKTRKLVVESLHKLMEPHPRYTYVNEEEIEIQKERKEKAKQYLNICKLTSVKKPVIKRIATGKDTCIDIITKIQKLDKNFCKLKLDTLTTYDMFDVLFYPNCVDFGRVAVSTYGESTLTIKNKTKYDITIKMGHGDIVLYTENMLPNIVIKLKSLDETKLIIFCNGFVEGVYRGTMNYIIGGIFRGKHPYSMEVGNPLLMVHERCLKFGMITSECFTTEVPVRIYNHFNITVDFKWSELLPETPFKIMPSSGSIPRHSCKICSVVFDSKPTKTKVHEVELITESKNARTIPIELTIITRKLAIKFLKQSVTFKDISLNLETTETVKLENSSREIAIFYVVEPLIPGFTIVPMSGIIRPKMIMTFDLIVKIPCILEFSFDVCIKINNKENVVLPINGNVVEPRITISPKNIYMPRIPCHLITYVPVTFQNLGSVRSEVSVLDTGDDNIFDVYLASGNDKQRVFEFSVEAGQSKIVYIKVYDVFRREYEMYIPFRVNGILGPPDENSSSTALNYYIGEYEQYYKNNPKVKLDTVNKDISYCRITGVITVPWIEFSEEKFEIYNLQGEKSVKKFKMTNTSKYCLFVTIITAKLAPSFSLELLDIDHKSLQITENHIKFGLDLEREANFSLSFQPKGYGRFVTTALLYLDKHMTIPYSNLTFVGKRETPRMTPSTYRIIFPPCEVETEMSRTITIDMEHETDIDLFECIYKENSNLSVEFVNCEVMEKDEVFHTIVTAEVKIYCETSFTGNLLLHFTHLTGSTCDVEVYFCFTHCVLTLHANHFVKPEDNPYPYFPLSSQSSLYEYMEKCIYFLEKWMFQQGFRRDLYPILPDTFHALASSLCSTKTKGINVSYMNFVRRIAGPLMKHLQKISLQGVEDSFKHVKEIHDTYKEIIHLLKSRGANVCALRARYLLSYDQFLSYCAHVTSNSNADLELMQQLQSDNDLFNRLSKQSWLNLILQSYKVFVMDSCFFECVCVSTQPRFIVKVLIDWYNEHISIQYNKLLGENKPVKYISNITTDLSDGIALASVITSYCPFLMEHFSVFSEVRAEYEEADIINNACLIIEATNLLRLYFPLSTEDFFEPNYLQMLFLSIHLFVILPMFETKDTITFQPPLLSSSSRLIAISPTSQESLTYTFFTLYNTRNNFIVDKAPAGENGKKMFLNVKYTANYVTEESCVLLVHGYNKTRIFDTYIIFLLRGQVGVLNPVRKCRVTGPLYRPNKVDVQVSSPFPTTSIFQIYITDVEPSLPVHFEKPPKSRFYLSRLNLIDKEIILHGPTKQQGQEPIDQKLFLQLICLSTQVGTSWIWFTSDVGDFYIKITTQPRWDLPIDSLQVKVKSWPMDPCSCGESCECYRTTILMIPHRNELMIKAMRYALLEHASDIMMQIFDRLIDSTTGKIILSMLLKEGGTTMADVNHILRSSNVFVITSRTLIPRIDEVTLLHHTNAVLALPVTIPANGKQEKYTITFTSECGMDIRTYRIFFVTSNVNLSAIESC